MRWAYGITTVPSRRNLLLRTALSLSRAGFESPWLFVDGSMFDAQYRKFPIQWAGLTFRFPAIRTHGNYVLALLEMYVRNPDCDRYAIFQDDVLAVGSLRCYLESCPYPPKGYLNLYLMHHNERHLRAEEKPGWYLSNQLGKGAQGLVYDREALCTLLTADHMCRRVEDPKRGWRNIDGGILESFRQAGYQEWVHKPSLLQHVGLKTSMGNLTVHEAFTFPGEGFDACQFTETPK